MHERLLLVERSIELLLLFTAIGSGPATGLISDRRLRLATMPILGFALSTSLLTTIAYFLPLATATWVVLVPAAVASLAVTIVLARRREATGRTREVAVPAVVLLIGVTLALLPPLIHGTQGPFALAILDEWGYADTSLFLQHHRVGDVLPAGVVRTDVAISNGSGLAKGNTRIGVDTVNASAATLFGSDTAESLAPFLAVLFGLFAVGVWLIVSGLGGSWQAAAFGSALSLTPAILTMVEDTTLGNLAAGVLAAPSLFFLLRSLRGSIADAVVAGALLGGLVAVYPEFLSPLFIVAACCAVVFGIDRARRGALREWVRLAVPRIGVAAVTALVIAPYAASRAFHYLSTLTGGDTGWSNGLPPRGLNVENVGSWAFGVHDLYAMSTFSAQPALRLAFSIYFPVVLAIVVLVGIGRLRISGVFVAAPILAAWTLGFFAYRKYQAGHCEYCLWKSFTFMIPFLAVGLAFGIERLWHSAGSRGAVFLQRALVAAVAVLALAAIGNSDRRLVERTLSTGAFCPCGLDDIGQRLDRLPSRSPVLIEGVDLMSHPTFTLNAAYFGARGHQRTILFDAGWPAIAYLVTTEAAPSYYSPDYGYVLTPFENVRSNRTPLGRYGLLLLERRAPIDVVVSAPGWTVSDTAPRIPQGSTPFRLRVSSKKAMDAAITVTLVRPTGNAASTLTFRSGRRRIETVATNHSDVCVNVHLRKGSTSIDATPNFGPLSVQPPNPLGLSAIKAVPGRCGTGRPVVPLSLDDGWFPVEQPANGSVFRWMDSSGTVAVGTPGTPRPSVRIGAQATSFHRDRRLDVWFGEKRLASFEVSQTKATKIAFVVPPGRGVARLLLVATPLADPASIVSPTDTRFVSVSLSHLSIQPDTPNSSRP